MTDELALLLVNFLFKYEIQFTCWLRRQPGVVLFFLHCWRCSVLCWCFWWSFCLWWRLVESSVRLHWIHLVSYGYLSQRACRSASNSAVSSVLSLPANNSIKYILLLVIRLFVSDCHKRCCHSALNHHCAIGMWQTDIWSATHNFSLVKHSPRLKCCLPRQCTLYDRRDFALMLTMTVVIHRGLWKCARWKCGTRLRGLENTGHENTRDIAHGKSLLRQ